MIAVMQPSATAEDIEHVVEVLRLHHLKAQISTGEQRTVIGVIGTGFPEDLLETLEVLPGVDRVTRITRPYKLASRDFKPADTVVEAGWGQRIGGREFVVMAGPCSVESREQLLRTADSVVASGATLLRGGAFKPRTSPYSFQGLGEEGLKLLAEVRREFGLAIGAGRDDACQLSSAESDRLESIQADQRRRRSPGGSGALRSKEGPRLRADRRGGSARRGSPSPHVRLPRPNSTGH